MRTLPPEMGELSSLWELNLEGTSIRDADLEHLKSLENLRYRFIRGTMEAAGAFTAVPGWGGVAMGGVGIAAAVIAGDPETAAGAWSDWLMVWLAAAGLASLLGGRLNRARHPVRSLPGR